MSYGSTFVQFDPNGKLSSRLSRSHYRRNDKDFDVSLSRVTETGPDRSTVRDSMIAYSNKMKSIQDARRVSGNTQNDPLFVRAKHIPKHPVRTPKKRRPMSFDELLGRDRESNRDRVSGAKQRPHSDKHKPRTIKDDEIHLPMLTERLQNTGSNVQVSLVSASDLYDLVDFSLRSKNTKAEHIQLRNMEAAENMSPRRRTNAIGRYGDDDVSRNDYARFQRTREPMKSNRKGASEISGDDLVPSSSYYEQVFSLEKTEHVAVPTDSSKSFSKLPLLPNEILKRRPNRVKRMKLQDPILEDIPEDSTIESGEITNSAQIEISRRVISPPPYRRSPKSLELASKPPLYAILEHNEKNGNSVASAGNDENEVSYRGDRKGRNDELSVYRRVLPNIDETKTTKKVLIRDDGDVRIEVTQCPPKQDAVNAKLKAQKRFKKLIYLRDGPR